MGNDIMNNSAMQISQKANTKFFVALTALRNGIGKAEKAQAFVRY